MAVDTPARITILGAGPIGIEAGLYGRFLGYDVEIFERGPLAAATHCWGHVRMFTPFCMNRSSLGLAALAAQDANYKPPRSDELLTGREWRTRYLLPLSQTDLLADHIHLQTQVVEVVRFESDDDERESLFRVTFRDETGITSQSSAHVVLDTTGVHDAPLGTGQGGASADGESNHRGEMEYGVPDVLGADQKRYAGARILLIGNDRSAAFTIAALQKLADRDSATRVTWITESGDPPLTPVPNDPFPERENLLRRANALAKTSDSAIQHVGNTCIASMRYRNEWSIALTGEHAGTHRFDRVIANVGFRTGARLCPDSRSGCYVLGSKGFAPPGDFLLTTGLDQIRGLFAILGDREDLDLYASF